MRVRNKEGGRELGHNKETEREPEVPHDSSNRWKEGKSERSRWGRNDGVDPKQASLSKGLWRKEGRFKPGEASSARDQGNGHEMGQLTKRMNDKQRCCER